MRASRRALRRRNKSAATPDEPPPSYPSGPTLRDERTRKFLEMHQVEERKFASFEAAEAFFTGQGFDIARRAPPPADPWPTRQTWALTPR